MDPHPDGEFSFVLFHMFPLPSLFLQKKKMSLTLRGEEEIEKARAELISAGGNKWVVVENRKHEGDTQTVEVGEGPWRPWTFLKG